MEEYDDMLPKRPGVREKRVKIAILDTGIDLDNKYISSKKGRIKCWPSNQECRDTDGHGTHVAYLILRLAKHVELRIAKINSSQNFTATKVKLLAEKIAKVSTPFWSSRIVESTCLWIKSLAL